MGRWIYKKSRGLHKYLGLISLIYLMWMSLSGILLNHPDLIQHFSVPQSLLPPSYQMSNWNRGALNQLIFSRINPEIAFASGKTGVWKSEDGGRHFRDFNQGLPESPFYRKTNSLVLIENPDPLLFAGTDDGLFVCNPTENNWQQLPLGQDRERIMKIVRVKQSLLVFTPSHLYVSEISTDHLRFQPTNLIRDAELLKRVSLMKLFFDFHDGNIWDLPGRLLFDMAGLLVFFLCLSGVITWVFPKRPRQKFKRIVSLNLSMPVFKFMFKYHLLLGIWVAALIGIIAGTGLFMRPPLISVIANASLPEAAYPGSLSQNPWDEKIQNAMVDERNDRIIIQASDGFWIGPSDLNSPFKQYDLDLPVFVMGATIFKPDDSGGIIAGSFGGLFRWDSNLKMTVDVLTGEEYSGESRFRPAEFMITGYFTTPKGDTFITAHKQGLKSLGSSGLTIKMPDEIGQEYRMPLWNFLFELHNGRIFRDILGSAYILIAPIGALILLFLMFTGIFDWVYLKIRSGK